MQIDPDEQTIPSTYVGAPEEQEEQPLRLDEATLHETLKGYKERAVLHTQKFTKEVKQNNRIYEDRPATMDLPFDENKQTKLTLKAAKKLPTYVVFTNVESGKASMFDRMFDLIVKYRGGSDDDIKAVVENAISYISRKGDFDDITLELGHQYLVHGFVSAHATVNDNEDESEDVDPIIKVHDLEKTYFSPDCETSTAGTSIPYVVTETLLTPQKINRLYGVKHEADQTTDNKENKVKTFVFMGECLYSDPLTKEDQVYNLFAVFSDKKLIFYTEIEHQIVRSASLYRRKEGMFGFGLAQLLKSHQAEKSIRRAQMIKAANHLAYRKWFVPTGQNINKDDLLNDDTDAVVLWDPTLAGGNKPEVAQTPQMNDVVGQENQRLDEEIQKVSAMFNLSGASNTTVVKTATGQSIYAEAAEKRVKLIRRPLATMFLKLVIDCLKIAQSNWTMNKLMTVTDPNSGEDTEFVLDIEKFKSIDLDKDVEIDVETPQFNRDLVKAQRTDMFKELKDIPGIDVQTLTEDFIKGAYDEKSPKRFFKKSVLVPGQQLTDPQTGETFVVDKSGQVVRPEDIPPEDPATGDSVTPTPSTTAQVLPTQ